MEIMDIIHYETSCVNLIFPNSFFGCSEFMDDLLPK